MKARRCGSLWIELLVVIAASALLAGVVMASIEGLLAGIRRDAAGQVCSARLGHLRAVLQAAWSGYVVDPHVQASLTTRSTSAGEFILERLVLVYVDGAGGRRLLTWEGTDSGTGRLQVAVAGAAANAGAEPAPVWLEFPGWGQLFVESLGGGLTETAAGPVLGDSLPALRCRFPAANCRAARRGFVLRPYG